ncbi:hypothetical protein Acsp06_03330 [Actinomycetospora sp. NBRC 106375]|uniref:DUF5947 family protein n=1 Tax=Actinomycetospora sp. NBRC 106375 TaxID=3032207 RepID=UPI0024A30B0C|nr:DUF5947 family protein [Actinomycetospora sp. NBRC 106375]GLZ44148.1 hypothetical protein Acsp06_03330 [Actinomycetospora sp. NBRC 106375]
MTAEVGGLRRYLTPRVTAPPVERCELCAEEVPAEHPHLVHPAERSLRCACRACALLFDHGAGGYRRVPDRHLVDPAFVLTDAQWDALQIPVGLAFFLRTDDRVLACYPSPAGATESDLDLASWADGVGAGALAGLLEPEVEALLVRREPAACLLVPIDACYRLVGLVRRHWRGFDGGAEAWAHIDGFFDDALARAREVTP